jgi:hypothetical protein
MATTNGNQPQGGEGRRNNDPASTLKLKLAASMIIRIIERNAGPGAADAFWDDDSLDFLDDAEPDPDPEYCDPNEETLPEMDMIKHNIFECD